MNINRNVVLAVCAMIFAFSNVTFAQDNPHWNKGTCQVCHQEAKPAAGAVNLSETPAESLCETCHGDRGNARPCRHLSDIPAAGQNLSEPFASSLKEGQIVCTTCHDLAFQCERPDPYYRYENASFLRERGTQSTGQYCSNCHDAELTKLNPHQDAAGTPPRPTCPLCHVSMPEPDAAGPQVVDFNMIHDLNDTCRGCHNVRPHPINTFAAKPTNEWIHLVVPPAEILENMKESEVETGINLPLSPVNGEIICATCHDPHERKAAGENGSQARQPGHRLRYNTICQACHDK